MRAAEWINLVALSIFLFAAWRRHETLRARLVMSIISAVGILAVVAVQFANSVFSPFATSVIRDWLPAPLMLTVYWQAGRFAEKPNENFQDKLRRLDRKWIGALLRSLRSEERRVGKECRL